MIRPLCIAALAILASRAPAWGAAVPTSISRVTSWSIDGGGNGSFTNNVSGNFGASISNPGGGSINANASQVSNVAPLFLAGSGGAHTDGGSNLPAAHALASYDLFFDLSGPHSFALAGTLTTGADGG